MRYALTIALALALPAPALAQDAGHLSHLSTGAELVAALNAGDAEAMGFVRGTVASVYHRGAQGDEAFHWAQRCVVETLMPIDQVVPYITAWVNAHPNPSPVGRFASIAVMHGMADYCTRVIDIPIPALPE
ncbi:MAG: hypothetical protein H6842_04820 [Rhodospirillaceae bacterium]|nr:hypothetical protein [Rhodospirillaceae bacterium]